MKKIIGIVLVIVVLLLSLTTFSFAATKITDKQLEQAAQNFISSKINKENYRIDIDSKAKNIKIFDGETEYIVKYNISSEQPKFVCEIPAKGVSYWEFDEYESNLMFPMMVVYTTISSTQGINVEDSYGYFFGNFLNTLFSSAQANSSYAIINDEYYSVVEYEDGNIYTSQWSKKYKEYLDIMYPSEIAFVFSDEADSYIWTIKKSNLSNNGYGLLSEMTVNLDSNLFEEHVEETDNSMNNKESRFSDVPTTLWSYQAIEACAKGGLVSGVGDGRFSPERGMKISEFCQVIANATGLKSGIDANGYWAGLAIKSCIDKGYIYSHGTVNPTNYDEVITREEAIAAMQLASGRTKLTGKNITINDIPDGSQISAKYKDLVVQAYNSGITTGVNEQLKFSPKNKLTRGQVCQLFFNVNWTTKIETQNDNKVDSKVENSTTPTETEIKADKKVAEEIGQAIQLALLMGDITESSISNKVIKYSEISVLNSYISLSYKPQSLANADYYISLDNKTIKVAIAINQDDANSLKNTNKEYDGTSSGWAVKWTI